jgi:hypothetical protein
MASDLSDRSGLQAGTGTTTVMLTEVVMSRPERLRSIVKASVYGVSFGNAICLLDKTYL